MTAAGIRPADFVERLRSSSANRRGDFMSGKVISYSFLKSPLGDMIGGATEKGVCFLEWTDRGGIEKIIKQVEKRYKCPAVETKGNIYLVRLQKELEEYFSGKRQYFDVAIDVTGTVFERLIWSHLMKIPYGRTVSYMQIAKAIDKPGAVRAVGRANGANYLAILIPCHRVIEASGGLGGYGGKIWRKKHLLALERNGVSECEGDLFAGVNGINDSQ
jgi:AraC family transcriptional regulator of adaptative response/methylated-DNA-[protein]-cysteine methyltransferase